MNKLLALSLLAAITLPAAAATTKKLEGIPPWIPGWDGDKWENPDVQTPKYIVGRIIAGYPHTPNGLKAAMPKIAVIFEGAKVMTPGKGDIAFIPCVGEIDLVVNAGPPGTGGDIGTAWAWQVVKDLCGACKPQLCTPASPDGGGSTGSTGGGNSSSLEGAAKEAPRMLSVVQESARVHAKYWVKTTPLKSKLTVSKPDVHGSRDCSEALDYALTDLHTKDTKWGYDCKNADCTKRSHNMAAYYSGSGDPHEGATDRFRVKIIEGQCDTRAHPVWERQIDHPAGFWSALGLVKKDSQVNKCTWVKENACIEGVFIESRSGNGHPDCAKGPGPGFTEEGENWIRLVNSSCQ